MANVKVNWTKGAVSEAIDKDVKSQIDNANNTLASWARYIKLCAEGHMQPTDARTLLIQINQRIAAQRAKLHDPRKLPKLQDSRVSEAKSILMLSTYKCWPAVIDMMKGMDTASGGRGVNAGTLLAVSKAVRSRDLAWDKNVAAAPPREKIMRAIDARRAKRRGNGNGKPTVRNIDQHLERLNANIAALKSWFGKAQGAQFVDALSKAAKAVKPFAAKVAKAKAEAAEASA